MSKFGEIPTQETPDNLSEGDETKDKVGEANIETRQEVELTEGEKEKLGEKAEEITNLLETQGEELEQEIENLPEEEREIFKEFTGKAKEKLKAVGKFIKDYLSTGGLVTATAVSAWATRYFATAPELSGGNDIVLATMTGVYSGALAVGAFVEGARAKYRRKEEKEEKMKA